MGLKSLSIRLLVLSLLATSTRAQDDAKSADLSIPVRDRAYPSERVPFLDNRLMVKAVRVSPQNDRLALAMNDGTLRIARFPLGDERAVGGGQIGQELRAEPKWTVVRGHEVGNFAGVNRQVHDVAWSPDGKKLATAGYDATLRIWSVSGEALAKAEPARPPYPFVKVRFADEGDTLVALNQQHEVSTWRLEGERLVRSKSLKLPVPPGAFAVRINDFAVSGGRLVLSTTTSSVKNNEELRTSSVRLYSLADLALIREHNVDEAGPVGLTPAADLVVIHCQKSPAVTEGVGAAKREVRPQVLQFKAWQVSDGSEAWTFEAGNVVAVEIEFPQVQDNVTRNFFFTLHSDGVRAWSPRSRGLKAHFQPSLETDDFVLQSLAPSAHGSWVATGTTFPGRGQPGSDECTEVTLWKVPE